MTVKFLLLKSGEDIIANVNELSIEEKTVGYLLEKPYIVKINSGNISLESEETQENKVSIVFYPYIPLTSQREIPIPSDWVITIVEPIEQLKRMYEEKTTKTLKNGKQDNKTTSIDKQSDSDNPD